jgi:hypothetical protein
VACDHNVAISLNESIAVYARSVILGCDQCLDKWARVFASVDKRKFDITITQTVKREAIIPLRN